MSRIVFGSFMQKNTDFSPVTELPGSGATSEQLARLAQRYQFAQDYTAGKQVLEVGCGAGIGLGTLSRTAQQIVGGDYTASLLKIAQQTYHARLPLVHLDAHALPFAAHRFDVVLLFEAIYYLTDALQFVREARRVLAPEGVLLIGTVNRQWDGFSPSPFSQRYYSSSELVTLLEEAGFQNIHLYGGFPVQKGSIQHHLLRWARRVFVKLGFMPKTLRGREFLKRLVYGKLSPLPPELTNLRAEKPVLLSESAPVYTILYAAAERIP